jgi:hypothetical protein
MYSSRSVLLKCQGLLKSQPKQFEGSIQRTFIKSGARWGKRFYFAAPAKSSAHLSSPIIKACFFFYYLRCVFIKMYGGCLLDQ